MLCAIAMISGVGNFDVRQCVRRPGEGEKVRDSQKRRAVLDLAAGVVQVLEHFSDLFAGIDSQSTVSTEFNRSGDVSTAVYECNCVDLPA